MSATGKTPIQLYRTGTAAAAPVAGNLAFGELALNYLDEKLYFKNAAGSVVSIKSTLKTLEDVYPVGSIYMNATNGTNPSTLFGFGTWVSFGAGRMPVGFNAADPLFDTAEEVGGSKSVPLLAHNHNYSGTTGLESANHVHGGTTDGVGDHAHTVPLTSGSPGSNGGYAGGSVIATTASGAAGAHSHSFTSGGVSANHNHTFGGTTSINSSGDQTNGNLPPYITVYMWKRTA